jgi:hypothetical protein
MLKNNFKSLRQILKNKLKMIPIILTLIIITNKLILGFNKFYGKLQRTVNGNKYYEIEG